MTFPGFIGASYTSRTAAVSTQRALNLYLEADESQAEGKGPRVLLATPGISTFVTLPTSPVRGLWTGLTSNLPGSTGADACFAVAGSKLYQVFSNATYSLLGDVGDDSGHSPVTMSVNGSQIFITSAGLGWIWDGNTLTLSRAFFNNGMGNVSSDGAGNLTLVSGDPFDATLVGSGIVIGGTVYKILTVPDETHLTVTLWPSSTASVAYRIMAGAGTVSSLGGGVLTWTSGDRFTTLLVNDVLLVDGTPALVTAITDDENITVTGYVAAGFNVDIQFSNAVPAAMGAFLDSYFIALPPNSKTFYISGNNDGQAWSPLDYGRKEAFPDDIASILVDHEELWLLGTETSEVWRNTGNADFPLQRDPGGFVHQGIRASFTAVSLANGTAWLGGDVRGNPIAWRAQGFQPVRVSTHGIEAIWSQYSVVSDATSYTYTEDGHQFWVISFPTADATWAYDATAGTWHERGWYSGGVDHRQRQATHGYAWNKHLVGDWQSGVIYQQSRAIYADAGASRHYVRTAPHLSNEELWSFYSRFRLSMAPGPSPTLSWSNDLGTTFNSAVAASTRGFGSGTQSSEWRRLGRGRDRIWRVDIVDSTHAIALVAAYLDMGAGNG